MTTREHDQMRDPEYLGDGVYAGHDGYQIWLSVNEPNHPIVALDGSVLAALIEYQKRIFRREK